MAYYLEKTSIIRELIKDDLHYWLSTAYHRLADRAAPSGIPSGYDAHRAIRYLSCDHDYRVSPVPAAGYPNRSPAIKYCAHQWKGIFKLMQILTTRLALLLLALVTAGCTPGPASPVNPIGIDTPARSPSMRPTNTATHTFSPTENLFPPTPPLNPAMLTPSAESARLGDILMKISADLPCQEYEWSPIVVVDATEARFECSNTNGENKNTIYISFRLGGDRLGLECFHGYIASSDESSYLVKVGGENGQIQNSYPRIERYFTWAAQGVKYAIIEFMDGNQNSILASPDLREKIYQKVTQLGLIAGDGEDCAQE